MCLTCISNDINIKESSESLISDKESTSDTLIFINSDEEVTLSEE